NNSCRITFRQSAEAACHVIDSLEQRMCPSGSSKQKSLQDHGRSSGDLVTSVPRDTSSSCKVVTSVTEMYASRCSCWTTFAVNASDYSRELVLFGRVSGSSE